MDTYADDLAALVETLDLKNAIHVGHSTGGGEVARYIGRHGTKRVAKAVLIGAVPPLMLKTAANPGGLPIEVFDDIRAGVLADRSQFFKDLSAAVLRLQPAGREGLARPARLVLAPGNAWPASRPRRLHQGVLRDRLHRGPQEVRRADADHPRRRRPDRADRRLGHAPSKLVRRRNSRSTLARRTGCARLTRTRSTPICSPSLGCDETW